MPMPDFATLQKFYRDRFRPATVEEFFLVDELARTQEILQLLHEKEVHLLSQPSDMFGAWSAIGHFQRRVATARRAWDKTLHDLQSLQEQMRAGASQPKPEPKKPEPKKPVASAQRPVKSPTLELVAGRSAGERREPSSKPSPAVRTRLPAASG